MVDIIKDRNGKSLDGGMYTDWDGLGEPTDANFYLVYIQADEWKAVDPERRIFKLGIPQGMPDSERMPDGMLNVMRLHPLSPDEVNAFYPKFERANRKLMATTGLLAQVSTAASENGEHLSQKVYKDLVKKYTNGSAVRL